jgi:hypothetical protein
VERTDRFSITEPNFDFGDGDLNNVSGRHKSDGPAGVGPGRRPWWLP